MQSYRIALGPHRSRKAFSPQSLPPAGSLEESSVRVAKVAGFSLHAGVAAARAGRLIAAEHARLEQIAKERRAKEQAAQTKSFEQIQRELLALRTLSLCLPCGMVTGLLQVNCYRRV